jgi:UDP-3-O-[3-hydroxymyristoyl] glucosamine N-acyltransferase
MIFDTPNTISFAELFAQVGAQDAKLLHGGEIGIRGVCPLSLSQAGLFSFSNAKLRATLERNDIKSGTALVVKESHTTAEDAKLAQQHGIALIVATNPRRWFFQGIRVLFGDLEKAAPGIHEMSVISASASIAETASIGPFVTIGDGAIIGDNVQIQHGVFIGRNCQIGSDTLIRANSVIGVAGQAVERDSSDQQILLPHLGHVSIGAHVIIGSGSVIVSGSMEETLIGDGCMIGNQVNIGHNCKIGEHCFIAPQTVIAGSVKIGRRCWVAPGVKILNKLRVGENSMIGLGSTVTKHVKADSYMFGSPAVQMRKINKYNR